MSLIPAFTIGVWNAWIFMPYLFLITLLAGKFKKGEDPGKTELDAQTKKEKRIFSFSMLVFFFAVIYSIFLPLKLGTIWFYAGLPVALIGLVILTVVMVNYAATPWDEPVTKGVYRISRNPVYFSEFLLDISIGIACASWIFILSGTIFMILTNIVVGSEERFCLKKYGNAYREHMDRTPRWIGIPRSGMSD